METYNQLMLFAKATVFSGSLISADNLQARARKMRCIQVRDTEVKDCVTLTSCLAQRHASARSEL